MKRTRKLCTTKLDIPKDNHFAILEFDSIHIPGDQRSIDFPGHGYPASTEQVIRYYSYTDRTEWEADVIQSQGKKVLALVIQVPKVEVVTTVTIDG